MKLLPIFALSAFILTGCSHLGFHSKPKTESHEKAATKEVIVYKTKSGAAWDLLSNDQLTLQLRNIDNGTNLTVIIEKGISLRNIPEGHWELTGFEENGRSFVSMNTSKKFVMKAIQNSTIYAGSIVTGCPKIGTSDFGLLKTMKFFNRYPFASPEGLCELVVGNDYAKVKSTIKKTKQFGKLKLQMGF